MSDMGIYKKFNEVVGSNKVNFNKVLELKREYEDNVLYSDNTQVKKYLDSDIDRFFIEFTISSLIVDGLNITDKQVEDLFYSDLLPSGKKLKDLYTITNLFDVVDLCLGVENNSNINLAEIIKEVHYTLGNRLYDNPGKLRNDNLLNSKGEVIGSPIERLSLDFGTLVQDMIMQMETTREPLLFASYIHNSLVGIMPFDEGNYTVARLMMNIVLVMHGYPTIAFTKKDLRMYDLAVDKYLKTGDINDFSQLLRNLMEYKLDDLIKECYYIEDNTLSIKDIRLLDLWGIKNGFEVYYKDSDVERNTASVYILSGENVITVDLTSREILYNQGYSSKDIQNVRKFIKDYEEDILYNAFR